VSRQYTVIVHNIATDGYPDMSNDDLVGRVAFIWDGAIVSGWPLHVDPADYSTPFSGVWESSEDHMGGSFEGVTEWVEFPEPFWSLRAQEPTG